MADAVDVILNAIMIGGLAVVAARLSRRARRAAARRTVPDRVKRYREMDSFELSQVLVAIRHRFDDKYANGYVDGLEAKRPDPPERHLRSVG